MSSRQSQRVTLPAWPSHPFVTDAAPLSRMRVADSRSLRELLRNESLRRPLFEQQRNGKRLLHRRLALRRQRGPLHASHPGIPAQLYAPRTT